jgi:DNA-binding MarR family transcriptional regulator
MDAEAPSTPGVRGIDRPAAADGGPVSYAIFALARAHRALAGALLRELGLHPGQELLLMRLFDRDGQTQSQLLEAVGLDHSTVSKALRRMEASGLVQRKQADHDRRVLLVHLTDAGEALRAPIEDLWRTLEARTTTGVDPETLGPFLAAAEELHRALSTSRDPSA